MTTTAPGRSYGGETPEARSSRRHRQLLESGLELFGTIGYRKATVRLLCREARVADRYFYEYFASTEELLIAVYHGCLDQLQATIIDALTDVAPDLDHLARAGLDAFLGAVEQDRRVARVVWFEVLGVSPQVEAAYIERTNQFGELLLAVGDERALLGESRTGDRSVVVNALVGGISQTVVNWVYQDFEAPRATLVSPLVRFLVATMQMSFDEQ